MGRRRLFALVRVASVLGGGGASASSDEKVWKTALMRAERAQLSSATTTLEELLARVSATAEEVLAAGDESLASDLFEVERNLRTAHRRLVAATRRAS